MYLKCSRGVVALTIYLCCVHFCVGQFLTFRNYEPAPTQPPLPFPPCRADNLQCLRRGLRTFFFLMDSRHLGMTPVDPMILNSVTVAVPYEQMSFLLRKVNVTGARWTKLEDRKFNLQNGKNGVIFKSDLHVVGEITMMLSGRSDPFVSYLTMELNDVETNITYSWSGQRGYDNEDYILIGQERIAVRNSKTPLFYLQPSGTEDAYMIEEVLTTKSAILDYLSNEVTIALMHTVVDNFRLFANQVPVKNFYLYS
ncbi:uncharacterized protein LOC119833910 isoform X2 [Zerene cesonia]|uniref:uncharacterized protein LOC119833910 isoform X2 n=1 Tax=Zerene cesonia TaxID=33412 RepID=UPI0018E4FB22|nr:uncharacterized protein LOC119833910 isoform X2 [Zerene cesonia]